MDNVKKYGLKEQVALLPLSPGAYQFLDKNGTIIYVGKAKSLRKRVSSYFMQNKEHSAKVQVLVRQIAAIRHIVVDTETDALLLENSLSDVFSSDSQPGMQDFSTATSFSAAKTFSRGAATLYSPLISIS